MTALALSLMLAAGAEPLRLGSEGQFAELGLALQLRATAAGPLGDTTAPAHLLEIRRLRLSLRGEVSAGRVQYAVQVNATPAAPELLDAWMAVHAGRGVRVRAGQFKTQVSRYRQQRFSDLAFVEWPLAAVHFGAERQLGLSARVEPELPVLAELGVFSGRNARAAFGRGVADAWGLRLESPSLLGSRAPPLSVHPEWMGRVEWRSGTQSARSVDTEGGPMRLTASLAGAWDLRPRAQQEFRARLVPELLVQWEGWALDGGLYFGWVDGDGSEAQLASVGVLAELSRRSASGLLGAVRLSRVDLQPGLRDRITRSTAQSPPATTQEVAVALSVPITGETLRLQSDLAWLRDSRDQWRARVQLQLVL